MGAPLNRNSPSSSTVNSMADVSSGKKSGDKREARREVRSRRRSDSRSSDLNDRLVSLDAFRGFIMMMLAAGGFGILAFSKIDKASPVWEIHSWDKWQAIGVHFDHPRWLSMLDNFSVSFWDLIQPSFMFMSARPCRSPVSGANTTGRVFLSVRSTPSYVQSLWYSSEFFCHQWDMKKRCGFSPMFCAR